MFQLTWIANFPGPFTAGVNQVIPYEFFAGDGMLTRLIFESIRQGSMVRQWNGQKSCSPTSRELGKTPYFYEVDLGVPRKIR